MVDLLRREVERLQKRMMERLDRQLFSNINANWGNESTTEDILEDILDLPYNWKAKTLFGVRHGRLRPLVQHHGRKREKPFPNKGRKRWRNQKRAWVMDPSLAPPPPPPLFFGSPPYPPYKFEWRFDHPRIITDAP